MPGNEVSNRTILMSLVALPFRVALGAPRDHPQLGTYNYVGREWPDVSKLYTGGYFEQFAVVGLVLNSLMLARAICFLLQPWRKFHVLPLATVLYVTNPYFIGQTIYTWPKALAGFFILLAWTSIRRGHGPAVVAASAGPGLALPSLCHRFRRLRRAVLPDSVAAGKIARAVRGPLSSCLWPDSRALDHLDKICPAHPFRFGSAELRRTRH